MVVEQTLQHLQIVKEKFPEGSAMREYLTAVERAIRGDITIEWDGDVIIVNGVLRYLAPEDVPPTPALIQAYLVNSYPAPVYHAFLKYLDEVLSDEKIKIPGPFFSELRRAWDVFAILSNAELPAVDFKVVWKGNQITAYIPFPVELGEVKGDTQLDISLAIAENLDKVLQEILSHVEVVE